MGSREKIKVRYVAAKYDGKIEEFLLKFFGEYGYSQLFFKVLGEKDGMKILRVRREKLTELLGALAICNNPRVRVVAVGGTLKSLKEKVSSARRSP